MDTALLDKLMPVVERHFADYRDDLQAKSELLGTLAAIAVATIYENPKYMPEMCAAFLDLMHQAFAEKLGH